MGGCSSGCRCKAALALAFTLAAAPFRRRRPLPGAGEVVGGGGVEPGEAGAGGSSSTSSLAFILPSLVVNVREADPPASFVCRSNFSSSPSILCSESEQKKMAEPKRHVLSLSWSVLNIKSEDDHLILCKQLNQSKLCFSVLTCLRQIYME